MADDQSPPAGPDLALGVSPGDFIAIDGDIKGRDCVLRYRSNGRVLAVASIYRDIDSLKAELAMEQA